MSSTSNLTVHVSAASAGKYYCKATSPGFGEVNAEATVLMKSPPVIHSPRAQYGSPSDTVRLECVALSVPVADKILWSYQGTIVGTRNDQNYYSVSIYIYIYIYRYTDISGSGSCLRTYTNVQSSRLRFYSVP